MAPHTLTFHFMLYWSGLSVIFFSLSPGPLKTRPPFFPSARSGSQPAPARWLPRRRHPPATFCLCSPKFMVVSGRGVFFFFFWDSSDSFHQTVEQQTGVVVVEVSCRAAGSPTHFTFHHIICIQRETPALEAV